MPMGGQVGSEFEVTVAGELLETASDLVFSHPGIKAVKSIADDDETDDVKTGSNTFTVSISEDCPPGIYEACVVTSYGVSTSRIFSVGDVSELVQDDPTTSLDRAKRLPVDSTCNATVPVRAVNHYLFAAKKDQRLVIDCLARGIDSRLNPVVIVADSQGRDLVAERLGDRLDFVAPDDGDYVIKVHDLTFQGGADYFYRLTIRGVVGDHVPPPPETTKEVLQFSWPPHGLSAKAQSNEASLDDQSHADCSTAQRISLPCDIAGRFYPSADVDLFQFEAKKGDVWWIEVASQRLGLPTNPTVLIQQQNAAGKSETWVDVAEFSDIASPIKVSTGGYSYDGPHYDTGSSDVLGEFVVPADGQYQLRLSDLFGGTRSDRRNQYRLIIRKAQPDFALAGWALHMGLRNGDRNVLSKPIALRPGATMALEVAALRRDGFDGPISLSMQDLPPCVTAQGIKIASGKSRGIILISAEPGAELGWTHAKMIGTAIINGKECVRPCRLASMTWPVKNARTEIPVPRLLEHVVVSVGNAEYAPLTLTAESDKVWEAVEGRKLTIPLTHLQRSDFSGANIKANTFGNGFESNPVFDLPLKAETSKVVLDLAKLKTPPGDYTIAFYGGGVVKYAPGENGPSSPSVGLTAAKTKKIKTVDTVDIMVSRPITIRVLPTDTSESTSKSK
tara:strand:- start:6977 stop:9001 length:2025 start_codon:yes stop_codon:yes gene_type:complete